MLPDNENDSNVQKKKYKMKTKNKDHKKMHSKWKISWSNNDLYANSTNINITLRLG